MTLGRFYSIAGCQYKSFQQYVVPYAKSGNAPPPRQLGRPSLIHRKDIAEALEDAVIEKPDSSLAELSKAVSEKVHVKLSVPSVYRGITDQGFMLKAPKSVPALTPIQRKIRDQYSFEMLTIYEGKRLCEIYVYISSDEVRICKGSDRKLHVWKRRGQRSEGIYQPKEKFDQSTMFWAAIGPNFRTPLIPIQGNMGGAQYIETIKASGLIEECNRLFGEFQWVLVQDGAKCHWSVEVVKWLITRCRISWGWPPNSPDLQPVELAWALLKRLLNAEGELTMARTRVLAVELWQRIPADVLNRLVASFVPRLELCAQLAGHTIVPYLNGHLHNLLERCDEFKQHEFPLWTMEEDEQLRELHGKYGNKWTKIAREMSWWSKKQIGPYDEEEPTIYDRNDIFHRVHLLRGRECGPPGPSHIIAWCPRRGMALAEIHGENKLLYTTVPGRQRDLFQELMARAGDEDLGVPPVIHAERESEIWQLFLQLEGGAGAAVEFHEPVWVPWNEESDDE
jgi:transposase